MRTFLALLVFGLVGTASPLASAQAPRESVADELSTGQLVMLELVGGKRIKGRLTQLGAEGVMLQLVDGTPMMVFWEQIERVALFRAAPSNWDPSWRRTSGLATRPKVSRSRFHTEALSLRLIVGGFVGKLESDFDDYWGDPDHNERTYGGFELVLAALHWRYVYWEIFRGIVVASNMGNSTRYAGFMGIGTALGVPVRVDSLGKHELRFGAHVTANLLLMGERDGAKAVFGASGVQLYYQYRLYKRFALQFGFLQHSFPVALTFFFGFTL